MQYDFNIYTLLLLEVFCEQMPGLQLTIYYVQRYGRTGAIRRATCVIACIALLGRLDD